MYKVGDRVVTLDPKFSPFGSKLLYVVGQEVRETVRISDTPDGKKSYAIPVDQITHVRG